MKICVACLSVVQVTATQICLYLFEIITLSRWINWRPCLPLVSDWRHLPGRMLTVSLATNAPGDPEAFSYRGNNSENSLLTHYARNYICAWAPNQSGPTDKLKYLRLHRAHALSAWVTAPVLQSSVAQVGKHLAEQMHRLQSGVLLQGTYNPYFTVFKDPITMKSNNPRMTDLLFSNLDFIKTTKQEAKQPEIA